MNRSASLPNTTKNWVPQVPIVGPGSNKPTYQIARSEKPGKLRKNSTRRKFCNKGTASAGPQMPQKKGWALAPTGSSLSNSLPVPCFSAASLEAPAGSSSSSSPHILPFSAASSSQPRACRRVPQTAQNTRGLYRLRKKATGVGKSVRARLVGQGFIPDCRKCLKIKAGL